MSLAGSVSRRSRGLSLQHRLRLRNASYVPGVLSVPGPEKLRRVWIRRWGGCTPSSQFVSDRGTLFFRPEKSHLPDVSEQLRRYSREPAIRQNAHFLEYER